MIKCVRCGNGNSDEVVFCQFCGTRLAAEPLPESVREVALGPSGSVSGSARPGQERGFRLVVVHRDGTDGMAYSLLGQQVDIGRTDGDLLFDDPHLAPRHARIVIGSNGWVLSPLEVRNGVYLRLKAPVDINDGDYFLIGKQVLRYEVLTDVERNVHAAIEHGVALFGTPTRPSWARLRQITPSGVTRDIYHLTRNDVVMGREQGDIVFSEDEFMSRRHAQISLRAGRGRLEDLGSSNGSFIRLRGPYNLSSGDLIRLGDELLRFELG
jgi:pSer/pThr/pTyr-binding forkhead associated (FHA) protein